MPERFEAGPRLGSAELGKLVEHPLDLIGLEVEGAISDVFGHLVKIHAVIIEPGDGRNKPTNRSNGIIRQASFGFLPLRRCCLEILQQGTESLRCINDFLVGTQQGQHQGDDARTFISGT